MQVDNLGMYAYRDVVAPVLGSVWNVIWARTAPWFASAHSNRILVSLTCSVELDGCSLRVQLTCCQLLLDIEIGWILSHSPRMLRRSSLDLTGRGLVRQWKPLSSGCRNSGTLPKGLLESRSQYWLTSHWPLLRSCGNMRMHTTRVNPSLEGSCVDLHSCVIRTRVHSRVIRTCLHQRVSWLHQCVIRTCLNECVIWTCLHCRVLWNCVHSRISRHCLH